MPKGPRTRHVVTASSGWTVHHGHDARLHSISAGSGELASGSRSHGNGADPARIVITMLFVPRPCQSTSESCGGDDDRHVWKGPQKEAAADGGAHAYHGRSA